MYHVKLYTVDGIVLDCIESVFDATKESNDGGYEGLLLYPINGDPWLVKMESRAAERHKDEMYDTNKTDLTEYKAVNLITNDEGPGTIYEEDRSWLAGSSRESSLMSAAAMASNLPNNILD